MAQIIVFPTPLPAPTDVDEDRLLSAMRAHPSSFVGPALRLVRGASSAS
jgi:hypothetical protein